jgi:hypothetical protein
MGKIFFSVPEHPDPTSYLMGTGCTVGRAEAHLLVLRLTMSGHIPPLPLYALMTCTGTALPLLLPGMCAQIYTHIVYR